MNKQTDREVAENIAEQFTNGERVEVKVIRNVNKRNKLPDFVMVFQGAAKICSQRLSPTTSQLFLFMISVMGYENFISVDVLFFAEELNMSTRSVLRGLKELEKNQVIIKTENLRDKRRNDYFINPIASWRGTSEKRVKTIQSIEKKQLELFSEQPKQISE
jgi:hydroxymethylpyrimidine/phosphomethylpyrimidine kinase